MCNYREYCTPVNPLSIVSFILPFFFGRCSTTIDIVTALTTIHHQFKLQINMQVVTCKKMKISGGLSYSQGSGNETNETKWLNVYMYIHKCIASFPRLPLPNTRDQYVYAELQPGKVANFQRILRFCAILREILGRSILGVSNLRGSYIF